MFEVFKRACYSYKDVLHDEADLEACAVYFSELETRWLSIRERVKLRLELDKRIPPDKSNLPSITREDSISHFASNSSLSPKSSRTSSYKAILSERRLEKATRRASLVAEEPLLVRKQSLAYQEFKLNQLKEELQLHTEITKLEAEEKACNELSSSRVHTGNLKSIKSRISVGWKDHVALPLVSDPDTIPAHIPHPNLLPIQDLRPAPIPCLPPLLLTISPAQERENNRIGLHPDRLLSQPDRLPSHSARTDLRADRVLSHPDRLTSQPHRLLSQPDRTVSVSVSVYSFINQS